MVKIAVIEDDIPIKELYEIKLKLEGYEVKTAENGKKGLDLVIKFKPDLIMLDLMMPEMTGDEMLKQLREFKWAHKIKVIILTNISKDEAPPILRFLNVDRYIVKAHYTPQQIVDIVKDVLG
jgi:two-component system alkaline phosphatase synthesis response regulator PhoP